MSSAQVPPAGRFPRLEPVRFAQRTVPRLLVATTRRDAEKTFLRFVEPGGSPGALRELSFGRFTAGVGRAVAFLRAQGVGPGDRVLLLAENSPEWQMVALAAQALRAEPAALFASLAGEPAAAIAQRVRPRVAFVSGPAQWEKLAPVARELAAAGLGAVLTPELPSPASVPPGVRTAPLAEATDDGAPGLDLDGLTALVAAAGEEDPFLLLFTSGTTGRPKGVRLAQRSMVHALDAGQASVGTSGADAGLHFLPFGHIAGHAQFTLALAQGHELTMVARREDFERALALRPTYLFSVPLVYERLRDAVEARVAALPAPARALVRRSLAGAARRRLDGSRAWSDRLGARIADRLVGRALRARLGGRMRGLFVGGAAAPPALFRFFESLGLPLVELYGMSETGGMISSNRLAGPRRERCAGRISADHDVRFAEDGELQLRGPLLLSGYLDAEDDREAWTSDGWFRTGDLGRIDAEGFLEIEGRRKNLMVLSTGKKLSPEPIEQAIAAVSPFHGAILLGEGRPFVAAAVFVARGELARIAAAGKDAAAELLPRVRDALAAFSEFEKPKRLLIVPGAPQEHEALMTPTLKIRRDALIAWLGPAANEIFAPG